MRKKGFRHNFLFVTEFTEIPQPLTAKIRYKWLSSFLSERANLLKNLKPILGVCLGACRKSAKSR